MILCGGTTLEQHPPTSVEEQDRNCAVQSPVAMYVELGRHAKRRVALVDEDEEVVILVNAVPPTAYNQGVTAVGAAARGPAVKCSFTYFVSKL